MSTSKDIFCRIETKDGPIRGVVEEIDDKIYYRFKGIPYAAPPIGNLRFLPPRPVKPWTEERDCTEHGNQPFSFTEEHRDVIFGSEDCLFIDVSTPNIKPEKPLPVMFWMGGFAYLYQMDYRLDPSFINDHDIVFVRCGFRLGPFGFLSFNDITAPGNIGLKDAVMGLNWIQKNISAFGGDPNNVTIFGNGTGGAMVHFIILSPMGSGLFHKAIVQSVTSLNTWALDKNPKQTAMNLAKRLNIESKCQLEVLEALRSIPAVEIFKATNDLQHEEIKLNERDTYDAIFKPCIEVEFEGEPAFLSKSPPLILKSGNYNRVPLLIGSNNIEGSVIEILKHDFYDFEKYKENICLLVPKPLARENSSASTIGQKLLKFYLGDNESFREDTKTQYLQLISDYYFLYYVNKTVKLHSQFSPECQVYYYILNYAGEWYGMEDIFQKFFNSIGHAAELPFLFPMKYPNWRGSRDSVKTRKRITKMWTNFAKYGNPTPDEDDPLLQIKWDPVENKDKLNYLSIGSELTKGRNPYHERMTFWDDLHRDHLFLRVLVYFNDLMISF